MHVQHPEPAGGKRACVKFREQPRREDTRGGGRADQGPRSDPRRVSAVRRAGGGALISDDQTDGRALPPTDLFSAPSSLEHPVTVPIVSATPLKGSRKQRLDDYLYPDQQLAPYPVELDRFVVMCRDPHGEWYLASRVAFARREDAERLAATYSPSRTPVIVDGAFKELAVQDIDD
jgi:hypothetical protein